MKNSPRTVADLKSASYNPRSITPMQLKKLKKSIHQYGDLSGVVFNSRLKELVTGHQRVKTLKGIPSRIVKTKHVDLLGTTFIGHIEFKNDAGELVKIPYREVNWDDQMHTMAANINANAAGGTWDTAKLGAIMAKLEKAEFDVETIALDSWTVGKSIGQFKKSREANVDPSNGRDDPADADANSGFAVIDPRSMNFEHRCPKCDYQWGKANAAAATAAPPVRVVKGSITPSKTKAKTKSVVATKTKTKAKTETKGRT